MLLVCAFPLCGFAQWQWIDQDGRKVYSDLAPPPSIPQKNILKQPSRTGYQGGMQVELPMSEPSAPKLTGKDPILEAKKKQAEDDEEAKRKSAADKLTQARAQNCERARSSLTVLQSGIRMKGPNANGEIDYLSDTSRAAEIERIRGIIGTDCK